MNNTQLNFQKICMYALVKKRTQYCGSAEKCQFTLCIAIFFSAMLSIAIFFSAECGPAALYGHSALYDPAVHIQRQSQRTEKCHFMPFFQC